MSFRTTIGLSVAAAALGLAGCTTPYPQDPQYPQTSSSYPTYPSSNPDYRAAGYGYVEAIEVVPAEQRSTGPGIGAIGGAIAGGVLGNQVGHGTGRAAATVGGAVAGGVIGHQVEQHVRGNNNAGTMYRFRVRMDDGSYQTYTQESHDNLRIGDRVRVQDGRLWAA